MGGQGSAKSHRVALSRRNDLGYELLTAPAVSDRDGSPLAPLCLELRAGDGVHSTRSGGPPPAVSVPDGLGPVMSHARDALAGCGRAPVFVTDAEADSVGHYRGWSDARHRFLVRADARPRVPYDSKEVALGEVADLLKGAGAFAFTRLVEFEGKQAEQFVAEAPVVLERPARTHRVDKATGKPVHKNVPGYPLPLVVAELRDEGGRVPARWLLPTNLPPSVPAAKVALWYYWRWRIERYHKLLKGAGQRVEQWQQETPAALARRLAVAAMACVPVWRLARDPAPEAARMREVLVKLGGRQMKRGRGLPGFTEPAPLAGPGVLVPMLLLPEDHHLDDLRQMTRRLLPGVLSKPLTPAHTGKPA